jgi:hypothetical protein
MLGLSGDFAELGEYWPIWFAHRKLLCNDFVVLGIAYSPPIQERFCLSDRDTYYEPRDEHREAAAYDVHKAVQHHLRLPETVCRIPVGRADLQHLRWGCLCTVILFCRAKGMQTTDL